MAGGHFPGRLDIGHRYRLSANGIVGYSDHHQESSAPLPFE
jgi:hypothetical protein